MTQTEAKLSIKTAEVFEPLLATHTESDEPVRYRAAFGGRGSGKSHFFAELLVEECYRNPGTRAVCVREVQKTLRDSSKAVIEEKIKKLGLGAHFNVLQDRIETRGGGLILFQGMQDHTAESIKSLEGVRIVWVEEAQTLSQRSLDLLRPTIRITGSEIWFSWNPRTKEDAVDAFLRQDAPSNAIVVKANWRNNPWWNDVLERERLEYYRKSPWSYDNIWEGEYGSVEGAYFAQVLAAARAQGRIGRVSADPILPMRAYFDIGGAGKHADATAIWIVQFVGREIRVIDYLEFAGQTIAFVANALRQHGYEQAQCVFPHDGVNAQALTGKRYVDHWRDAGFDCLDPIPNQGTGAAHQRIEAVRRVFPFCWFNETQCEAGLSALANYHEKVDEQRRIGLGPLHDWSSHCADAFGLMAICYIEPIDEEEGEEYRRDYISGRNEITGY